MSCICSIHNGIKKTVIGSRIYHNIIKRRFFYSNKYCSPFDIPKQNCINSAIQHLLKEPNPYLVNYIPDTEHDNENNIVFNISARYCKIRAVHGNIINFDNKSITKRNSLNRISLKSNSVRNSLCNKLSLQSVKISTSIKAVSSNPDAFLINNKNINIKELQNKSISI